ncbi:hypothetical protein EJ994_04475 [Maribacter sp. MJ134]|uniref:hypothetical protein n=1 Tax=Maribacter sp. MJ134 TaxID=2496865 RepID=UPI000F8327E4|nr:hypothetical protein [Maribacter sp. MJ134]AZQ58098.1 hypothetical protein EJ994_04475 [Maribacter sp. MJ134]
MAKTKLKIVYKKQKPYIICDTNVWYEMSTGNYEKPDGFDLIPTSFSLVELSASQAMVEEPKFYQDTIKMIYKNCGPIIPENPFDYILQNQFEDYTPQDSKDLVQMLSAFGDLMNREIKEGSTIDNETKQKVIEECQKQRGHSQSLAAIANQDLQELRKNINKGIGKKKHLEIDPSEVNKQMVISFLNNYTKQTNYKINWNKFDWSAIELFMIVTEIYFKKLETTKDMKVKGNDIVDWFNIMYVSQGDKYLTFDNKWRNYILNDDRIKDYLIT